MDAVGRGLTDVVARGLLGYESDRGPVAFVPTAFDMELLRVADAALRSGTALGVTVPLPGTYTPMLLAAAALVRAIVTTHEVGARVAVVSRQLRLRPFYDQLYCSSVRLSDVVPRAALSDDGRESVVRGRPDAPGRLYLTGELVRVERLLSRDSRLDGVVVDATATGDERVDATLARLPRGLPVLYLTADPADPVLDALAARGGVSWCWDAGRLASLAMVDRRNLEGRPLPSTARPDETGRALAAPARDLARAATAQVRVLGPAGQGELDDALARLHVALGRARRGGATGPDALLWAWGVASTLATLPTAPAVYDRAAGRAWGARPIGDAAARAYRHAGSEEGDARGAWLEIADALDQALRAAERANPKLELLLDWIAERSSVGPPSVVVVKNRAATVALTTTLDESATAPRGWDRHVEIVTPRDLLAGRLRVEPGAALLGGPLPRAYAAVLACPPADHLDILAAGPWEANRARTQVLAARSRLRDATLLSLRQSAVALGVDTRGMSLGPTPRSVRTLLDGEPLAPRPVAVDPADCWEPFSLDLLGELGARATHAADVQGPARAGVDGGPDARVDIDTIAVHLDDPAGAGEGRVLLVEPNALMRRRSGAGFEDRVAAKALKKGDVIALVDGDARRDLFAAVTERLAELPVYAVLAGLVDYWHARADRAGRLSGMTHATILRAIRSRGSRITSEAAVGTWIRGVVEGPLDPDDVARFARAVGDFRLVDMAPKIAEALGVLRRAHRKVGRALAAMADGDRLATASGALDPTLGLRVADVLDAVSVHTVTRVDLAPRPVPAARVGVLLDSRQAREAERQGQTTRRRESAGDPTSAGRASTVPIDDDR